MQQAEKLNQPLIVISGDKPMGAVINIKLLHQLQSSLNKKKSGKKKKSMLDFAGIITDKSLPSDLSVNHDTYAWD